jgi:hypothetical protein
VLFIHFGPGSTAWAGNGRGAVGMAHQGYDLQVTRYDEKALERDLLHPASLN